MLEVAFINASIAPIIEKRASNEKLKRKKSPKRAFFCPKMDFFFTFADPGIYLFGT